MKLMRSLLAAALTVASSFALLPSGAAAQTQGGQCGSCTPGADLGLDGVGDCNNPNGWQKTTSTGTCTFVNKVTVTACGWGLCTWRLIGPQKPPQQVWACLTSQECGFRVRWEYTSDCSGLTPNVTTNCPASIVFPCTTFPSTLPPAATFTNVLPPDSSACGPANNDNLFLGMACGAGCTYRLTLATGGNTATVAMALGCGTCDTQGHGQQPP